jgi:hypothetical protein
MASIVSMPKRTVLILSLSKDAPPLCRPLDADIQMSFPLEAAAARGGLDQSRPKLMRFLERIHARPAYKRALERGGAYALLR